ncbi:hypothetical protein JXZ92_00785 [Mycoplasma sp. CSL10137]|uniref:hypothetical protein n=1 Tax=unclassified Mycoplasma TaxID=2683645 RepID=UPI00197BA37E|nr:MULTISPECIES: hypothetical protein [unclassified Mycoplasma]MBN4083359.1 hypothetical protein [Mycoplasma sp. CSL10137]MBN4084339.1 hypothetical protein [Mycoplasma sp. CSL10166]
MKKSKNKIEKQFTKVIEEVINENHLPVEEIKKYNKNKIIYIIALLSFIAVLALIGVVVYLIFLTQK